MTPSKTYCPAPFVHFYHKGTPVGKTCCMARNTIIHKTSSKATWANSRLNSVRQDVLDDKPISDCEPCYKLEASGGQQEVGETALIPILVKAVQELSSEIKNIKKTCKCMNE